MRLKIEARAVSLYYISLEFFPEDVPGDFYFLVFKGETEEGPWVRLTPELLDSNEYLDHTSNLRHLDRLFYYKVQAVDENSQVLVESTPQTLASIPSQVGIEIARRLRNYLDSRGGRRCIIYRTRRSGARCSCLDRELQAKTKSVCPICYGTGWQGGYYTGIVTPTIFRESSNVELETGTGGTVSPQNASIILPNYPLLHPGDLIVDEQGRRWKVNSVSHKYLRGFLTSQDAQLVLIIPGDPEYLFESMSYRDTGWLYDPKSDITS